jgi:DNA-binding CsgD family transcriptional regulator
MEVDGDARPSKSRVQQRFVDELAVARAAAVAKSSRSTVATRQWECVWDVQSDGVQYVLLRRARRAAESPAALTDREERVVALAASGLRTKEIAFQLGISDTTVRVLLMRAARKYGVRGRKAVVTKWSAERRREPDAAFAENL